MAGVVETSEEPGLAYNTLVAFGPDGGGLASYREIHLFDAQGFGESVFINPGESLEHGGRFGLMTCYDLRFPELATSLADAGAQVGRSVLVDPIGVVEADLGLEPCVRVVEVSLEIVDRVRELFPMFRQRRLKG